MVDKRGVSIIRDGRETTEEEKPMSELEQTTNKPQRYLSKGQVAVVVAGALVTGALVTGALATGFIVGAIGYRVARNKR
jgi:hypothetical protein